MIFHITYVAVARQAAHPDSVPQPNPYLLLDPVPQPHPDPQRRGGKKS